eukprot:1354000-Lingulodinium_polyedra.AAC.1
MLKPAGSSRLEPAGAPARRSARGQACPSAGARMGVGCMGATPRPCRQPPAGPRHGAIPF